ncbi:MAG: hypothetical protein ACYCYL_13440, partial [Acidithiobacillus sp.]
HLVTPLLRLRIVQHKLEFITISGFWPKVRNIYMVLMVLMVLAGVRRIRDNWYHSVSWLLDWPGRMA